jgi:hypothetical protein
MIEKTECPPCEFPDIEERWNEGEDAQSLQSMTSHLDDWEKDGLVFAKKGGVKPVSRN